VWLSYHFLSRDRASGFHSHVWNLKIFSLAKTQLKGTAMIKEITIDGEQIIIDFAGAPFWKYYVLQLVCLFLFRKRLTNPTD
jgi:hypothetical protein